MNTVDNEGLEYAKNTICLKLFDMIEKDYIMVTRSQETFLMIKIDNDEFLVIDSHKSAHGTLNTMNAIKYITRYDLYKGLIQIGCKIV